MSTPCTLCGGYHETLRQSKNCQIRSRENAEVVQDLSSQLILGVKRGVFAPRGWFNPNSRYCHDGLKHRRDD